MDKRKPIQVPLLWSVDMHKETFDLMVSAWPELTSDERVRLLEAIVEGPPAEWLSHLEPEERQRLDDRIIYDRLKRLEEIQGDDLPEPGRSVLADLQAKYSGWQPHEGERAHFTMWHETRWGLESDYTAKDLAKLGSKELLDILRNHQSNREGLLDNWRYLSTSRPERAVATLCVLLKKDGNITSDVLRLTLDGLDDQALSRPPIARRLFRVLDETMAHSAFDEGTHNSVCRVLEIVARQSELPVDENLFWRLWDRLFEASLQQCKAATPQENWEWINWAINQPTGMLAEAAMALLFQGRFLINQRFPTETIQILDRLVANGNPRTRAARVCLAQRAVFLSAVDSDWMGEKFAPYFDWEQSEEEAAALWDSFGLGGRITLEFWSLLKDPLLASFTQERLGKLSDTGEKLSALLTAIILELPKDRIPKKAVREAIKAMTPGGRREVADYLALSLQSSGADGASDRIWTEKIAPFIQDFWPKEQNFIEPDSSQQLTLAAIATADEFEAAVDLIYRFLTQVQHWGHAVHALEESDHPDRQPLASLRITEKLVPPDNVLPSEKLRAVLDRIGNADPSLRGLASFEALDHGLQATGV